MLYERRAGSLVILSTGTPDQISFLDVRWRGGSQLFGWYRKLPTLESVVISALLISVILGCGAGLSTREDTPAPIHNILLVTIDTLRADHVGFFGGMAATPNLDRLATSGTAFQRCIAQVPLTLPSHTTILSGTYPLYHHVRDNGGFTVPAKLELVSETLQRNGFATGAFIGAYVLNSKWGLDQGFDIYDEGFYPTHSEKLLLQNSRRAEEVVTPALEWIERVGDRRFFAWVHLYDPHAPYDPPPPFDEDKDHLYRGEVEYADHVLGELFDRLEEQGLLSDTLVIVTSDHGEGLGEHEEREHGFFVYDSTVRVPLIVRPPFPPAVARWDDIVEHVDLAPTILDAAGVEIPAAVQGSSLWPVITGANPAPKKTAYSETFYPRLHYGWSELRALHADDHKFIQAPHPEIYDLEPDPRETTNLASDPAYAAELDGLEGALEDLVSDFSAGALTPTETTMSAKDRAALAALGYVTTKVAVNEGGALADPKDKLAVFNRLNDAAGLVQDGRFEEAISVATQAVADEPDLVDGYILLGNAQRKLGELGPAVASYDRALGLKPDANFVMIDLLGCLLDLGNPSGALKRGMGFLKVFPRDPALNDQVSVAAAEVGEIERALHYAEVALVGDPGNSRMLTRAGELSLRAGSRERAATFLQQALDADPIAPGASYLLGRIAAAENRPDEALTFFRQEVTNHPDAYHAAFDAALILASRGQRSEALQFCRLAVAAEPPLGGPYFMLATDLADNGGDLEEAIALCRAGIAAEPSKKARLLGYQILLRLLQRQGDSEAFHHAAREAESLQAELANE